MKHGPQSAAEAEQFYKTLQRFAIAVRQGVADPWMAIPDATTDHKELIRKMIDWSPEERAEVKGFLERAFSLVEEDRRPRLTVVPSVE